ncbi:hypothetical protein GCM10020256_55220 [Streptomyces thermocoprophilus]
MRWSQRWARGDTNSSSAIRGVDLGAYLAAVLRGAQPVDVELELRFEEPGDELPADLLVDEALGGQCPRRRLEAGVAQLVDGGAEHGLEVGGEIAGVGDGVRLAVGGAGLGGGLRGQIQEGVQEDVSFGGPPAVDGLLADACAGGDALDGGLRIPDLADEGERGLEDRTPGPFTATAGVGCLLAGLRGGRADVHASNIPAHTRRTVSRQGLREYGARCPRPAHCR